MVSCLWWQQGLFAATLVVLPLVAPAEVRVELQRRNVMENESFHVTFKVLDAKKAAEPIWTPVQRDFTILDKRQTYLFQNVNGRKQSVTAWRLELKPKRSGNLTLPALAFGRHTSQPQKIHVQRRATTRRRGAEIFVEASAEPLDPYVQQQVRFVFRVFMTKNLSGKVTEPSFSPDVVAIEPLPEARYRNRQHGKNYEVYERSYMLYPQTSGTIKINPVVLTGQYIQNGRRLAVTKQSQALQLNVRPVPAVFTGNFWLPTSDLQLQHEWSGDLSQWARGEPLTRTVKLIASNLMASQLPEITIPPQPGLNVYANVKPVLKTLSGASDRRGERTQKFVFIPTQSGRLVLPEIRIPWWNTRTDQMEYATLERQDAEIQSPPQSRLTMAEQVPPQTATANHAGTQQVGHAWVWLSIVLGCGWLLTLAWVLRRPLLRCIHRHDTRQSRAAALKHAYKKVERACAAQDVRAVRSALLQWAGIVWDARPPRNLGDIARRCTPALKRRIQAFDRAAYGHGQWHADSLRQAVRHEPTETRVSADAPDPASLEPLYK